MPATPQIPLTVQERRELERLRDTSVKAYLRERAAAILRVQMMAVYKVVAGGY